MFKVSYVSAVDGLKEARQIMDRIYRENPKHWPNGLTPEHFDGGVYLIREKQSNAAVGFCGWQERNEIKDRGGRKTARSKDPVLDRLGDMYGVDAIKVGYYSIGILPEYRRNHFAKEALQKLIAVKSAGVDQVRALIMASNTPSLGLADALGVEKLVKKAGRFDFLRPVTRMFGTSVPEGILGTSARDLARRSGVTLVGPSDVLTRMTNFGTSRILGHAVNRNPYSLMDEVLGQFKQYPKFRPQDQSMKGVRGLVYSPFGTAPNRQTKNITTVNAKWSPLDSDKLEEAKAFKGFIPETRSVTDFKGNTAEKLEQMKLELGKQLIFKPRSGLASQPGKLTNESSSAARVRAAVNRPDRLVQKRIPLQNLPGWQKAVDNFLAKHIPGVSNFNRGTREMRVHAINGRVLPYGSMERGSITGHLNFLLPWRTSRMRQAEALAQQALDQLPARLRNRSVYGFDIGFNRAGKPFIIETNPTDTVGASGMLGHPMVMDATSAAIQGKLPLYVKGRRLGTALAGAGALGAGYEATH